MQRKHIQKEIFGWALAIFMPLIILTFLFSVVFAIATVNQQSMEPNYTKGDVLYYSRFVGAEQMPKRGDLVLFYADHRTESGILFELEQRFVDVTDRFRSLYDQKNVRYVKRVIGLPGDEIDITDGRVYINGVVLVESYVVFDKTEQGKQLYPYKVPQRMLFVMGDNRGVSEDSRAFGAIDIRSVEGIGRYRIWPPSRFGKISQIDPMQ